MNNNEYVELGVVTKPHGLGGEVFLHYYGEDVKLLRGNIWLKDLEKNFKPTKITRAKEHKNQVIIKFEDINDRNGAESMRGVVLYIHENELPELADDEVYIHAILGLEIIDFNSNQRVGTLERVDFISSQEIWTIIDDVGDEILFPAVSEFVEKIDLENEKIFINPPEGLLELNKKDS